MSDASSHQMAAPRARREPLRSKNICARGADSCARAARPSSARPSSRPSLESALGSRSCSRFCPAVRLTPKSRMIESRVRKRCVNSMSSAVSPPLARRCGAFVEATAEFLQSPRNRAKTDGAAEQSTRLRGGLDSTWTDSVCNNHPDFVQRACLRAARDRRTLGSESTLKHCSSNTAPLPRGLAWALQCTPPCELPMRRRCRGRRRRDERVRSGIRPQGLRA
jgi:hypothetical protein